MKEEGKKLLHLPMSWSVYKELNTFIQKKQGYIKKGDISKWIEIGVRGLLATTDQQQQSAKNLQRTQKQIVLVAKTWQKVSTYTLDKSGFELQVGKIVPSKMLEDGIIFHCGHQKRTVEGWKLKFQAHGYIQPMANDPLAYEVVKSGFVVPAFDKQELR